MIIFALGPPGPPENIILLSSGPSSLLLQADVSRFGYILPRSLTFVVTSANGGTRIVSAGLQNSKVAVANVQGLQASTKYTVIAYATNEIGRSTNSTSATFRTRKFLWGRKI